MNAELMQKLGYQFQDPGLLKKALTHRSCPGENNERLEFLGDSIVNFIVAEALFHQFPRAPEGDLSRWRATLINRESLASLAREFNLSQYLVLGPGELKSGGSERLSILTCAMEALIGAVYLDGGFSQVKECVLRWYQSSLQSLSNAASHKDPKTVLQELLQKIHRPLPVYHVEAIEGEAHRQIFVVCCEVTGINEKIIGKGSSRRRAEQAAAVAMLDHIRAVGLIKNE